MNQKLPLPALITERSGLAGSPLNSGLIVKNRIDYGHQGKVFETNRIGGGFYGN